MSTQYQVSKELVEASLVPELTDKGWPQLLQTAKNIQISPATAVRSYEDLLKVRALCVWLEEKLEEENREDSERIAARKAGFMPYIKEMKEILEKAEPQFVSLTKATLLAEKKIGDAIQEQNKLKEKFIDFVNTTSRRIILSVDVKELAKIQMRIGTEKGNASSYGEYETYIKEVCDKLLPLIDDVKQVLKTNTKLEKEFEAASKNDMPKAVLLQQEIYDNKKVIEEKAKIIASDAFEQIKSLEITNLDLVTAAIKPRLRKWASEVLDIEALYKKHPELVSKVPNPKAIAKFVKDKEDAGELNEYEDTIIHGLRIFYKFFFVSFSK